DAETMLAITNSPYSLEMAAQEEVAQGRYEKAETRLRRLRRWMPHHVGVWTLSAECAFQRNDRDGSRASLTEALRIEPHADGVRSWLAELDGTAATLASAARQAAGDYSVPQSLLLAMAHAESRGQDLALDEKSSHGWLRLNPWRRS